MEKEEILQSAIAGDINAFQTLFAELQSQLKSYLYRSGIAKGGIFYNVQPGTKDK